MKLEQLKNKLLEKSVMFEENVLMKNLTSFKIGGPVDVFVHTAVFSDVKEVTEICAEIGVPIFFLGNGSNLLVSDKGLRGVALKLSGSIELGASASISCDGDVVCCSAGVSVKDLCRFARDRSLAGTEFAFGIPGTVGGALYMNAGAYGGQMSDVVCSAKFMTHDGGISVIDAEDMKLGYRHSVFVDMNALILEVCFKLKKGDKSEIERKMQKYMERRREKQPLEFPSGGSFFKRPPGFFAAALIDESGLKGYTVGGAQVSEKHAGFVVNIGNATCEDVKQLCRDVQKKVYEDHGVTLKREVKYIGEGEF